LFIQEAGIVSKRSVLTTVLVLAAGAFFTPVYAQDVAGMANSEIAKWSIITAGFALAFAAGLAALAQGKAVSSATEAIARNPGAAGDIRGSLLLGLVLIESLAIYVLLISLILFFLYPFGGRP
jgi:F-type H+-transporting ATPase subunit c